MIYTVTKKRGFLFLLTSILVFVIICLFSSSIKAVEEDSPWISAEDVTTNRLEEQRDAYLDKRGWELGFSTQNPNNAYLDWGFSNIKASPGDIDFGQSRVFAFEDAYTEAIGKFVSSRRSEIITETVSEFILDEMPESEITADDWRERADVFLEKLIDIGEAKLDELLERFDIDPEKYRDVEKSQQKQILHDSISIPATTRAVESSSGLIIEATFEDNNGVGVLIKHSKKTEQIARQIARGEPAVLGVDYDARKYVETHLQELEDKNVPFVYSVRIMENQQGENVLIAFGQWSPKVTKTTSETLAEARIKGAKDMARSRAEAALTNFINSTVVAENIRQAVEEEELYEQIGEGRTQRVETHEIGSYIENIVEQYGEVTLEGITTVNTWTTNHIQTGHLLVGHILKWSPATRDAARGEFKEDTQETKEDEEEEEDEGEVIKSPF